MAHLTSNRLRTTLVVAALSAPACASESGLVAPVVLLAAAALLHIVVVTLRGAGPRKLGSYILGEQVGSGNMGAVYRAQAKHGRRVAIKLLHAERTSAHDRARFEREVQLTRRLEHPNTISVLDAGNTPDGTPYYVMEYVEGVDLQTLIEREGPLPAARVIDILAQASAALSEAHALGMVHRDIKPANIMLIRRDGQSDQIKLVDFGLAELVGENPEVFATDAETISGTPLYMAPESITAPDAIDARTDLYSLGAVGYFLLTGQNVFSGKSLVELCSKHIHEVPVAPSHRTDNAIPDDLEALVLACLAKSPMARPASADNLRAALLSSSENEAQEAARDRVFGDRVAVLERVSQLDLEGFAATLSHCPANVLPMHVRAWQTSLDRLQCYIDAQAA